jgi:hypothetical protein
MLTGKHWKYWRPGARVRLGFRNPIALRQKFPLLALRTGSAGNR